jgi:hypothetical protein
VLRPIAHGAHQALDFHQAALDPQKPLSERFAVTTGKSRLDQIPRHAGERS